MKIEKIIGENGVLPQLCGRGSCPLAVIASTGDVFVQGYIPVASESAELTSPEGEGFIRIPRATFERIARQVLTA